VNYKDQPVFIWEKKLIKPKDKKYEGNRRKDIRQREKLKLGV
jgi:hypothetical protein